MKETPTDGPDHPLPAAGDGEGSGLPSGPLPVGLSKKKRVRAALRASEERYRTLFTSIDEGFAFCEVVRDATGRAVDYRLLEVNPAFEALTGLAADGATGRLAREAVPGLERSWVEAFARVEETGEPARFEGHVAPLDRWYEVHAFSNWTGRFAVLFSDITERKRAEEALRASAARATFRATFADALRPLADPVEVQAVAARLLGEHLGASRVFYAEVDPDGGADRVAADYCDGVPSAAGTHDLGDYGPRVAAALEAGQTLAADDCEADPKLMARDRARYAALAVRAYVAVPLVKRSRLVGHVMVHQAEPRAWTPEEVALVEETAERTWAAAEQRRAEGARRESEGKLRLLVESATDYAIFTTDLDRRVTSWNAGAEALFGYTEGEIVGRSGDVLFTPEDRDAGVPEKEAAQALAEGRAPDNRWHLRKDGTRFYVNGVSTPLRDGAVVGFVKIARDLTAQREAEAAHAASEERYRTLFTSIDEGFALCEVVVGDDGRPTDYRFLDVNPAFGEMTGLPPDAAGRTARELVPDLEDRWVETYARVGIGREAVRFENGSEAMGRWFDVYAAPVEAPEKRRFALVFTDVTERKRAEREVRALNATLEGRVRERTVQVRKLAARLAVAEQTERQRIAHVLHDDLQQQLFGLSMVLSLLQRAPAGEAVGTLAGRASGILDEAVRTTRTLAAELSPAILQADRLGDVLEWVAGEKRDKYGLEVDVEVRDDVRVADPALRILLYQTLREILFNVVKHSGGAHARLVAWADGDCAAVRVEDDGAGFDAKAVGDALPGGFGLFSVRERLELVGGRFEIDSAPGKGTRVTLSVPSGGGAPDSP